MNKITAQQVLDAARQAFIVENKPPSRNKPSLTAPACVYRNKQGNRCAVGLCIPDDHAALDHYGDIHSLAKKFPELVDKRQLKKLNTLQAELHDMLSYLDRETPMWRDGVEERDKIYAQVARELGLKYERVFPDA